VSIGEKGTVAANGLYDELRSRGVEVLFDDRDARPGDKFADAELLGIPHRVTVSDRLIESGSFEHVNRGSGEMKTLTKDELFATIGI
jgi:prolyl-tRNA synthetase